MEYLIRVILHDHAPGGDYRELHRRLTKAGCTPFVSADDGTHWRLPPGEYLRTTNITASDLRRRVVNIVLKSTAHGKTVIVSPGDSMSWSGLDPAS